MEKPNARHDDPETSKLAGEQMELLGMAARGRLVVVDLLNRYPGSTYRELYKKHVTQSRADGVDPKFEEPAALMRRLSEVGEKFDRRRCEITGKLSSVWREREDVKK